MLQPVGAQFGAEGIVTDPPLLPRLAKVEKPLFTCSLPQLGQTTSASANMLRKNLSNRSLHS
jgi:hypothetical protein